MSLEVHQMAMAAERRLLPTQAERGWRVEEAKASMRKVPTPRAGRSRAQFATALARFSQSLRKTTEPARPAAAPAT